MKALVLAVLLAALAVIARPGDASPTLARVYVGPDGLAHVVGVADGSDSALAKEPGQVSVADPRLSNDRRTAGWLVEERNCCTSYPIPERLAVYAVGRKQIISDGLMIYDWAFVGGGREVALSTGVVHGATRRTLSLYDVHSGRRLASWTGDAKATPPRWALRLRQ
jgi:hypothetical protein